MMKLSGVFCLLGLLSMSGLQFKPASQVDQQTKALSTTPVVEEKTTSQTGLSFAAPVLYSSGGDYANSIAVADLNGDGKLDLIVANGCPDQSCETDATVGILLGNGDGTFQTAATYDSGSAGAASVAVADVNHDGKADLLVVHGSGSIADAAVSVLLGDGDGTFQLAGTFDSGALRTQGIAVADVNGDGNSDLLLSDTCTSENIHGCFGGAVSVLLGNGDGTFQTAVVYDSGGPDALAIVAVDLNGDNKLDLVVTTLCSNASCKSNVGVLLGNGDGTFQPVASYGPGGKGPTALAVADLNGDGKADLIVANLCFGGGDCADGDAGILMGNGDGTFQTAVPYKSGGYQAASVAVVDVDGDGKLDVVVGNSCVSQSNCTSGVIGVLLGNGDGTLEPAVTFAESGIAGPALALGDVSGDGKPDLLVANDTSSSQRNGIVSVLLNTSRFPTNTTLSSSPNPSSFGQSVTFSSTIVQQFGAGTPTGTVTFLDGATTLGTSSLDGTGVANLSTTALAIGSHSVTAAYSGDSAFAPSTSAVLNQMVQGAVATLSQTSLNFGSQTGNITSTPQTVILTNTGNINLTSSLTITGTGAVDFAQTNNCGSSIAAGASCTISVTFTPTALGTISAVVSIADNAANSPQTVSVTGVGVLPAVTFSPATVTFPSQLVFTSSQTEMVLLTNTGLGVLNIAKISVKGQFSETNSCGSSVPPGGHCRISVTFKPTTKGPLTGDVFVADNAPRNVSSFAVNGTGTYVQLSPTTIDFGTQPVGTKSLSRRITLTNKGDGAVDFTAISIVGLNKSDFGQTNTCGASLATGGSCFIKVTFTPSATGKRIGGVSIVDDGGGSPQNVSLGGTGTP